MHFYPQSKHTHSDASCRASWSALEEVSFWTKQETDLTEHPPPWNLSLSSTVFGSRSDNLSVFCVEREKRKNRKSKSNLTICKFAHLQYSCLCAGKWWTNKEDKTWRKEEWKTIAAVSISLLLMPLSQSQVLTFSTDVSHVLSYHLKDICHPSCERLSNCCDLHQKTEQSQWRLHVGI